MTTIEQVIENLREEFASTVYVSVNCAGSVWLLPKGHRRGLAQVASAEVLELVRAALDHLTVEDVLRDEHEPQLLVFAREVGEETGVGFLYWTDEREPSHVICIPTLLDPKGRKPFPIPEALAA